jgi:hypothetical protein
LSIDLLSGESFMRTPGSKNFVGQSVFNNESGIFGGLNNIRNLGINKPILSGEKLKIISENEGQWNPPVSLLNHCALLEKLEISLESEALAVAACLLHDNSVLAAEAKSSAAAKNIVTTQVATKPGQPKFG